MDELFGQDTTPSASAARHEATEPPAILLLCAAPVAYLSDAVGQCIVYKGALAYLGLSDVLYLAAPTIALTGILGEEIGRRTVQQAQVGLIAFDPVREEIVEWRHYNAP